MKKKCSIKGCDNNALTRGWCNRHYLKWWTHGDVLAGKDIRPKGSGTPHNGGYWHRQIDGRLVLDHVLEAERALGRRLPKGVQVHHVDGDGRNNTHSNLVICPNDQYHKLLHRRQEAMDACGNPNWLKCTFCKRHDAPENMRVQKNGRKKYHRECANEYRRRKTA